jgi:hypothetical protein
VIERWDGEERRFLEKVWTDCWTNLTGLLAANLLFLLWCSPSVVAALLALPRLAAGLAILTVGPALLGLLTYAANVARGRPASFWRDSLRGFRSGYRAGVIAAVGVAAALLANRLAVTHAMAASMAAGALAIWAAQLALLMALALVGAHALSLVGLYQQGIREAFRNGVLLTVVYPAPTLGLAAAAVLATLASRVLRGGPLVIVPALLAVLAVNTTFLLVRQHTVENR